VIGRTRGSEAELGGGRHLKETGDLIFVMAIGWQEIENTKREVDLGPLTI